MRLRRIPGADERIASHFAVIQEPAEHKGKWHEVFGNDHPIYLEIGAGKGQFITTHAMNHPEINYIAIEMMSSVLIRALDKREQMESDNLFFICMDAETLPEIFAEGEVDRIYLNFSDPWPKKRHHKRRLTSREFLARYEQVLAKDGIIEFKTDQEPLFDFSLEELAEAGWVELASTRDLYKSPLIEGNVPTEYEDRFTTLGNKIFKLIMKPGDKE